MNANVHHALPLLMHSRSPSPYRRPGELRWRSLTSEDLRFAIQAPSIGSAVGAASSFTCEDVVNAQATVHTPGSASELLPIDVGLETVIVEPTQSDVSPRPTDRSQELAFGSLSEPLLFPASEKAIDDVSLTILANGIDGLLTGTDTLKERAPSPASARLLSRKQFLSEQALRLPTI